MAVEFLVHRANDDFVILRQAGFTNFEKPFLYLLFGEFRALLIDTGAGNADVATAVDREVSAWLGGGDATASILSWCTATATATMSPGMRRSRIGQASRWCRPSCRRFATSSASLRGPMAPAMCISAVASST